MCTLYQLSERMDAGRNKCDEEGDGPICELTKLAQIGPSWLKGHPSRHTTLTQH